MQPMNEPEDMKIVDLDARGEVLPPKHDKKIVIDADTIVFASCSVCEYEAYDLEAGTETWDINLDDAYNHALGKLELILENIGGVIDNVELHFTGGRESFRYDLLKKAFPEDPTMWYKAKRKKKKTPEGLNDLKLRMMEEHGGFMWYEYEADDAVVMRKKLLGDDCILCAVDKDVLKNTVGTHWNYYDSQMHSISMKWQTFDEHEARFNQHLQVITGDKSDNVPGLKGIGEAKAAKFIEVGMTDEELWDGVLAAYTKHCKYGDPLDMAILNMRLVNMHQLNVDGIIELWKPYNHEEEEDVTDS